MIESHWWQQHSPAFDWKFVKRKNKILKQARLSKCAIVQARKAKITAIGSRFSPPISIHSMKLNLKMDQRSMSWNLPCREQRWRDYVGLAAETKAGWRVGGVCLCYFWWWDSKMLKNSSLFLLSPLLYRNFPSGWESAEFMSYRNPKLTKTLPFEAYR